MALSIGYKIHILPPSLLAKLDEAWIAVLTREDYYNNKNKAGLTKSVKFIESSKPLSYDVISTHVTQQDIQTIKPETLRNLVEGVFIMPIPHNTPSNANDEYFLGQFNLTPLGELLQDVGSKLKSIMDPADYVKGGELIGNFRGQKVRSDGIDLESIPVTILVATIEHVDIPNLIKNLPKYKYHWLYDTAGLPNGGGNLPEGPNPDDLNLLPPGGQ